MKKLFLLFVSTMAFLMPNGITAQSSDTAVEKFSFHAGTQKPLEVLLDVDAGEVVVEKGTDAVSGTITAKYFKDEYRTKIRFDEKENRLRVRLDKDDWSHIKHEEDDREGHWANLHLVLPYGVDQLFDAQIKAGEVNLSVGGLRFREFNLSVWAGQVKVQFDEPNAMIMDNLDINAKVGEIKLFKLGNARFREASINGGIGELNVDFSGAMEDECRAKVDLDIGETTLVLPNSIGIRMHVGGGLGFLSQKNIDESFYQRGRYYYSEGYDENKKKCYILVTPGLGELNIERE